MRFLDDLTAVLVLTATLLLLVVVAPAAPLRIVLSLPVVLFLPGYALVAALYPMREDLPALERIGLSLGASLAVVPLLALALNFTPWGLRPRAILAALTLFIAFSILLAIRARARTSAGRQGVDLRHLLEAARRWPRPTLLRGAVALIVLLLAAGQTGLLGRPRVREAYTEFYLLGPDGKAEGYPRRLFVGEASTVILGVVNRERRSAAYTVRIRADAELLGAVGPLLLRDGQRWEQPVPFALRSPGRRVKVEFLLDVDGTARSPYRRLHLWVDVRTF